ncbi:MAG: hypothetical protein QW341_04045, partial [Candidatus Bathyarchaeia archaeon]
YLVKEKGSIKSELKKQGRRIVIDLQIPKLNDYPQIPRVRLLLMKRGGEKDTLDINNIDSEAIVKYLERVKEEIAVLVNRGLKFKISLYGSKDAEKVNFALSSLLLSIILGGIGSITKRAFGSLKLLSFKFGDELKIDQEIQKIFKELQDKEFTKDELKETIEKLCNITVNFAKKLFNIDKAQDFHGISTVPSLSNIRIEVVDCVSPNLVKIGNAFVKQTWKPHPMVQGRDLHTWILGLPRFQEGTGYAVKIKHDHQTYDPLRRLSSIGVRYFEARNKNFIIVFGLLSDDWPKDLYHIRRKEQRDREKLVKDIPPGNSLRDVFDRAFKQVLSKVCEK